MRKILALVLGITMGLVMVSCGGKTATATNAAPVVTNAAVVDTNAAAAPAADTNVAKPAPAPVNADAGQTKGLE
ncbi:MAG: hypothetical protein A2Y33_12240 [Spirochaetes bacterium GWF1_51_8]|nr:MAG: hypothetical protein A2Y33_12240 [Spirochaetes bacterium GWF1_51_8]